MRALRVLGLEGFIYTLRGLRDEVVTDVVAVLQKAYTDSGSLLRQVEVAVVLETAMIKSMWHEALQPYIQGCCLPDHLQATNSPRGPLGLGLWLL